MRKFILSIALLGSVAVAAPAMAQDYRGQGGYNGGQYNNGYNKGYNNGGGYNQSSARLRQIGVRIDRNIRSGTLNRREAYALRREYANLVALDRRLSRGGLTRWERQTLDNRTDASHDPADDDSTPGPSLATSGGARLGIASDPLSQQGSELQTDAPGCDVCGSITVRSGTCYKCLNCGASLGCS